MQTKVSEGSATLKLEQSTLNSCSYITLANVPTDCMEMIKITQNKMLISFEKSSLDMKLKSQEECDLMNPALVGDPKF